MGTLIANSHSHGPNANTPEATVGPSAAAAETTSALSPMPRPSRLGG